MRIKFDVLSIGVEVSSIGIYIDSIDYEEDKKRKNQYIATVTKVGVDKKTIFFNSGRQLIKDFKKVTLLSRSFNDFRDGVYSVFDKHEELLTELGKYFNAWTGLDCIGYKRIRVPVPSDIKLLSEYITYLEGLENEYLTDIIKELNGFRDSMI